MKKENNWGPLTIHTTNIPQILHFFRGISELTVIHIMSKDKRGMMATNCFVYIFKSVCCALRGWGPFKSALIWREGKEASILPGCICGKLFRPSTSTFESICRVGHISRDSTKNPKNPRVEKHRAVSADMVTRHIKLQKKIPFHKTDNCQILSYF